MYCMNCGSQIPDGSAFCPSCGSPVGGGAPRAYPRVDRGKGQLAGSFVNQAATAINEMTGGKGRLAGRFVNQAATAINEMTGGKGHVDLKVSNLFDSVFTQHSRTDVDEVFSSGAPSTTPALKDISSEWPHPWVYSRVFLGLLIAFLGLYFILDSTENEIVLPGLIFLGALLVPFSVVVLFFETNAFKDVSFARVLEMFFVGGVFSIAAALFFGNFIPNSGTGDLVPSMLTGVIEELGEAAIVVYFFSKTHKQNYILSGLLIGAAVGAGFAVFETAGYIYNSLIQSGFSAAMDTTVLRAALAIGSHVAWAAVEGGALALCDEGKGFSMSHLTDARFLFFLIACVVLHGIWNADIPILDIIITTIGVPKFVLLIVGVWLLLFVLLNRGFAQVNEITRTYDSGVSQAAGV